MLPRFISVAIESCGNIVPAIINLSAVSLVEHCPNTGGALIYFKANLSRVLTIEPSQKVIATIDTMARCKVVDETELDSES